MSRASHNCVFPAVASSYHVKRITGTLLEWIRDHSSWRTTTPTTVIVFVLGRRSKCYNTKISTFWYRSLFVNTKQPVIVSTQKRTIVIQYKWIVYFIANCTPLFLGKHFILTINSYSFITMHPHVCYAASCSLWAYTWIPKFHNCQSLTTLALLMMTMIPLVNAKHYRDTYKISDSLNKSLIKSGKLDTCWTWKNFHKVALPSKSFH